MMSLSDAIERASQSFVGWAVMTMLGGAVWVVRRVVTNQKQIEMLQREIEMRDTRRQEDRDLIRDIQSDVKQLRRDVSARG